mgnify:CR=1 FL=1
MLAWIKAKAKWLLGGLVAAFAAIGIWQLLGRRAGIPKTLGVDNQSKADGWQRAENDPEKPFVANPLSKETLDEENARIDSELAARRK